MNFVVNRTFYRHFLWYYLGANNQFILVTTIDFPLLVPQKSSVESSIKDDGYQKSMFSVHMQATDQTCQTCSQN